MLQKLICSVLLRKVTHTQTHARTHARTRSPFLGLLSEPKMYSIFFCFSILFVEITLFLWFCLHSWHFSWAPVDIDNALHYSDLCLFLGNVISTKSCHHYWHVTPEPGVRPRLHHHGASLWPGLGRVEWRRTLPWQHLRPRVTSRDSKEISELPLPYKISCIVSSEIPLISLVTSHSSWSQPQQILHVRFAQKTDAWCSGGGECTGGQYSRNI